jgi:hypothetical protein
VTYEAIFEASVALLAGKVLRGEEAAGNGSWGVIDCNHALGAFNARSGHWVERCNEGYPARFSREEAEETARKLTGSAYEGHAGYSAVEIPERPRLVMAGRHCSATEAGLLFECVDWSDGPADVVAVGSAFEAAAAFVALMGERLTYAAVYAPEAA